MANRWHFGECSTHGSVWLRCIGGSPEQGGYVYTCHVCEVEARNKPPQTYQYPFVTFFSEATA
jgi:hypothetical protein